MTTGSERLKKLPLRKAASIAWKSIRVRLLRSLLVTSGIILAITFLTFILTSDAFVRHVPDRASQALIDALTKSGIFDPELQEQAKMETRWMVGLALLISFVGIVNAMLMSVTERFREIGTMKCLGAMDGLIIQLFLMESTFQGIVGTVCGILCGTALAYAEGLSKYGGEVWGLIPMAAQAKTLGICLLSGTALTVFGALYPARQAARMNPVDAMRSEV
jgi:putative ABC transport system permease protein